MGKEIINSKKGAARVPLKRICYMRFWKWLYFLAEKKIKELHLDKHKNDIKCPCCKMWFSISGLRYKHTYLDDKGEVVSVRCGQCQEVSFWNAGIAPVLVRCDIEGTPF